jgi:Bacterial archaeo-eukaryotic release factor family 3
MQALTLEDLRLLSAPRGAPCVSIYLPAQVGPAATEQNRIRFKNLASRAESELAARHPRLAPAFAQQFAAIAKAAPWSQGAHGFAAFFGVDGERHFLLSQSTPEYVLVAETFHLRPLLKSFESNHRYYLLLLTTRDARLLRGTSSGLVPAELPDLARASAGAVIEREYETSSGARSAGRVSVHYGHGAERAENTSDQVHFLKAVDRAICSALRDEKTPLVVACPEELHGPWQRIGRYAGLLEPGLIGHFQSTSAQALHAKAWPLVEAESQRLAQRAIEAYGAEVVRGRASGEISTIARAAVQGRVRELLLADEEQLAGLLDRDTGEVRKPDPNAPSDDVYDDVAEAVLLRGGEVHTLPKARMPQGLPAVALFRW